MLGRIFTYSVKNILRNAFLSISSIIVLTLLMFFINVLILLNGVSSVIVESINQKLSISLYLKKEYNDVSVEVVDLMQDVKKLNKAIDVEYKGKEKILEEMREKEPKLVHILERSNPLPDTIVLSKIQLSDYEQVNQIVESKMFVLANGEDAGNFANYTTQYQKIKDVITVLENLRFGLLVTIAIFFASIAIISYSVISNFIYYYKDEIYITKLVGGANSFIYGPFVIQGIIYAIIAFCLNLLIFNVGLQYVKVVFDSYDFNQILISKPLLLLEFVLFILVGAISGYFSSIGHVRKGVPK